MQTLSFITSLSNKKLCVSKLSALLCLPYFDKPISLAFTKISMPNSYLPYESTSENDDVIFITSDNIYRQPALLTSPRKLPASAGIYWIKQAWVLFRQRPLTWIGMTLTIMMIMVLLSFVPFAGGIAAHFITFLFLGGFLLAADALAEQSELVFQYLFSGFQYKFLELSLLALLYLLIMMVFVFIFFIFFIVFMPFQHIKDFSNITILIAPISLLIVLVYIWMMSFWFATALVVLNDLNPIRAMIMSIKGCLKNILPFTVYGFIFLLISLILSLVTLGFAFLALVPISYLSYYTSYRSVWTDPSLDT